MAATLHLPKKILAIKFRALGDTVLMTAALDQLRKAYPDAKIHVAVTDGWSSVLEHHPAVDRIWPYERRQEAAARAKTIARMALQMRKEKFDYVIGFHASPSSATLAFATGARTRAIHFHGHKDKNRYSTVEIAGKGQVKPIIERDMDTIRALGLSIPAGCLPTLYLTAEEREEADRALQGLNLQGPVMAMGMGATRPTKLWPIERFSKVAAEYCKKTGGSVLAFTGPGEEKLAADFLKALDETASTEVRSKIRLISQKSLREVMAIIEKCQLFLGNDSGLKHIAAAFKVPTVTLIGPEHPFEWHPYELNKNPYFFIDGLACRKDHMPGMPAWCSLWTCKTEGHKCMVGISEDAVLQECVKLVS